MVVFELELEDARFLVEELRERMEHVAHDIGAARKLDDEEQEEELCADLAKLANLVAELEQSLAHERVEPDPAAAEQRPPADS